MNLLQQVAPQIEIGLVGASQPLQRGSVGPDRLLIELVLPGPGCRRCRNGLNCVHIQVVDGNSTFLQPRPKPLPSEDCANEHKDLGKEFSSLRDAQALQAQYHSVTACSQSIQD